MRQILVIFWEPSTAWHQNNGREKEKLNLIAIAIETYACVTERKEKKRKKKRNLNQNNDFISCRAHVTQWKASSKKWWWHLAATTIDGVILKIERTVVCAILQRFSHGTACLSQQQQKNSSTCFAVYVCTVLLRCVFMKSTDFCRLLRF